MQKVEGSSPFSRFNESPGNPGFFLCPNDTDRGDLVGATSRRYQIRVPRPPRAQCGRSEERPSRQQTYVRWTRRLGLRTVADRSTIEWTQATWNPVTGCDKVSPGCAHCYAETFAERWRGIPGHPYEQGFDLRLWPERLEQPLRWKRPRAHLRQLDERSLPRGHPGDLYARRVRRHGTRAAAHVSDPDQAPRAAGRVGADASVAANVWMGVSIENRASSTAPTTCAKCQRPFASSRQSRCSGPSKGSTSTASTG